MKTKYLFYSLALAGAFAACTQEELIESPVANNDLASRPVAGVVEITTDDVESRFVESTGDFESGDVFGFYLMDEFDPKGSAIEEGENHLAEHWNANAPYWTYQNHWFGMYNFTKGIQSNYPFRAEKQGDKIIWKNDAKLVEGNYFAMYPQNEKALNRRELWHSIEPSKKLELTSTDNGVRKFMNVENQFFLGYKQIHRDATSSAESVLKINMPLKGVMVPLAFEFESVQLSEIKLDKISFKNASGDALPTLAYIDPSSYNGAERKIAEKNTYEKWVIADVVNAEPVGCAPDYQAHDKYNESLTWTKHTIMNLVDWTVPGKQGVPYGLTNTAEAYEYSFTFPENTIMDSKDRLTVGVVVPAMDKERWNDLQVDIYAWEKQNGKWVYSVLRGNVNNNFSLKLMDETTIWNQAEETQYWNRIPVRFDNFSWKPAETDVMTTNTRDMEEAVRGRLAAQPNGPIALTIAPDANGVEVTTAFLKELKANAKDGRPITLTFSGRRGGSVSFNEDNTMLSSKEIMTEVNDFLQFIYDETVTVYNNAEQTVDGVLGTTNNNKTTKLVNGGSAKLNVVYDGNIVAEVDNGGEMEVSNAVVKEINNSYKLTLGSGSNVGYVMNGSDAEVVVDAPYNGTATVETFENYGGYRCNTCIRPTVNVNVGTLKVTYFNNGWKDGDDERAGVMNIAKDAVVEVETEMINYSDIDIINGVPVQRTEFVNNGTIKGNGRLQNFATVDNYWEISVKVDNSAGIINNMPTDMEKGILTRVNNAAVINTYGGEIKNLTNVGEDAVVNVMTGNAHLNLTSSCKGKIIFNGVEGAHVAGSSNVKKIFRTVENMKATDLFLKMANTGSTYLYLGHDLTLDFVDGKSNVAKTMEGIVVEGKYVNVAGSELGKTYTFGEANLSVNEDCEFHIEKNLTNLVVKSIDGNVGEIHVGANCTLTVGSDTYGQGTIIKGGETSVTGSI